MAIAVEQTVSNTVEAAAQLTLASWTPAADELLLLAIAVRDETVTFTVSGNGLTWNQVADVDNVQGQAGIAVYWAQGASPSSGSIQIDTSGSTNIAAIASRFSGVADSSPVEASNSNQGPSVDDADMVIEVTTSTADAWVWAAGTHRGNTFTVPADETEIDANIVAGSGGDRASVSTWYQEVASPGAVEVGEAGDLGSSGDWATIGVSIKPASGGGGGGGSGLLDVEVGDAAVYSVGLADAVVHGVGLDDESVDSVELSDAGIYSVGLDDESVYSVEVSDASQT